MSNQNLFIVDTGATYHIKMDNMALANLQKVSKTVKMGQLFVKVLFQGDYECEAHQTDGTIKKVVLKDVRVAPGAWCNLLSLTRLLNNGYNLKGNQQGLTAIWCKIMITFDQTIQARSSYLLGIQLVPKWGSIINPTFPLNHRIFTPKHKLTNRTIESYLKATNTSFLTLPPTHPGVANEGSPPRPQPPSHFGNLGRFNVAAP